MKIAYVVTRADVGGAQVHIRDLCRALTARGEEVVVLVGGKGPYLDELAKLGIPYISLRHLVAPIRPYRDLRALWELVAALRSVHPDVVCAHTSKAGFLGRIASGILRIPSVFTPHGWTITDRVSARQGRMFRMAEKFAALFTSRIINVCRYEVDLAIQHGVAPPRKLALVYNGMHDVPESMLGDPERHPPRLAMVARMERQKDHETLLDALAGLKDLAWELELIGDGPLEPEVRARVQRLGIADRVIFSGYRPEVAPLLARCQIFVLTSRFEAFPYSILEAMRAGLPVVATDVGGVREAVTEDVTGYLVPRCHVEAVRARLAALIWDPALRRRMGDAGRKKFGVHFHFDEMLRRTIRVYEEAVAEGTGRSGGDVAVAEAGD